jgi:hypothetical protein
LRFSASYAADLRELLFRLDAFGCGPHAQIDAQTRHCANDGERTGVDRRSMAAIIDSLPVRGVEEPLENGEEPPARNARQPVDIIAIYPQLVSGLR